MFTRSEGTPCVLFQSNDSSHQPVKASDHTNQSKLSSNSTPKERIHAQGCPTHQITSMLAGIQRAWKASTHAWNVKETDVLYMRFWFLWVLMLHSVRCVALRRSCPCISIEQIPGSLVSAYVLKPRYFNQRSFTLAECGRCNPSSHAEGYGMTELKLLVKWFHVNWNA